MPSQLCPLDDPVLSSKSQDPVLEENSDAANQLYGRQTGRKRTYFMSLERESGNKNVRECYNMKGQYVWAGKVESMLQTIEELGTRVSMLKKM
ncbi:hypothetical protein MMC17_000719 [Xylographa soralifera]|nr:hypothetical protein [Xylographa soralifera]